MGRKAKIALAAGGVLVAGVALFVRAQLVLPPPSDAARTSEGTAAPAFSLGATTGGTLTLADLTRGRTAAVLVFYRGDW